MTTSEANDHATPQARRATTARLVLDAVDRDRDWRDLGRRAAAQSAGTRSRFRLRAGASPSGRVHGVVLGRGRHDGLAMGDGPAAGKREVAAHLDWLVGGHAGAVGGGHDTWHHAT